MTTLAGFTIFQEMFSFLWISYSCLGATGIQVGFFLSNLSGLTWETIFVSGSRITP